MEKFTNTQIKKEKKRMIRNLIIFIVIIGISIMCWNWRNNVISTANSQIMNLDSIIVNEEEKVDKKAYLDINAIPYEFAVSDETTNSYYIVTDGTYLYIAFMGPGDFATLNNEEIKNTPVRIEGVTYQTDDQIKQLAIDAYNEGLEEEKQISISEFDSYFGSVYLNMTVGTEAIATLPTTLAIFTFIFGIVGTIAKIYELYVFKKSISKMEEGFIEELDNEMNSSNAFYYEKSRLYLTEKYIINFKNRFIVLNYKDIVWMYPYTVRTNGIKTSQAIKVMNDQGKTYTIATVEFITKAKKEVYNEIWNTIVSKNNSIVLGYTKENIQEMKNRFKKNRI